MSIQVKFQKYLDLKALLDLAESGDAVAIEKLETELNDRELRLAFLQFINNISSSSGGATAAGAATEAKQDAANALLTPIKTAVEVLSTASPADSQNIADIETKLGAVETLLATGNGQSDQVEQLLTDIKSVATTMDADTGAILLAVDEAEQKLDAVVTAINTAEAAANTDRDADIALSTTRNTTLVDIDTKLGQLVTQGTQNAVDNAAISQGITDLNTKVTTAITEVTAAKNAITDGNTQNHTDLLALLTQLQTQFGAIDNVEALLTANGGELTLIKQSVANTLTQLTQFRTENATGLATLNTSTQQVLSAIPVQTTALVSAIQGLFDIEVDIGTSTIVAPATERRLIERSVAINKTTQARSNPVYRELDGTLITDGTVIDATLTETEAIQYTNTQLPYGINGVLVGYKRLVFKVNSGSPSTLISTTFTDTTGAIIPALPVGAVPLLERNDYETKSVFKEYTSLSTGDVTVNIQSLADTVAGTPVRVVGYLIQLYAFGEETKTVEVQLPNSDVKQLNTTRRSTSDNAVDRYEAIESNVTTVVKQTTAAGANQIAINLKYRLI